MTDRPSAATPEEVLDGWRRQHRSGAADRQSEQWWLADHDFLDLIRRAQAAQAPRVLTADDPEPAVGSVVLAPDNVAWQRFGSGWDCNSNGDPCGWAFMLALGGLRLIHDAAAKEGQA